MSESQPTSSTNNHDLNNKLASDGVIMTSVLKVKYNNSSGQYCFCVLHRNSTGIATLSVYKSKKPLSQKQRLKTNIWFVHVITPSVIIRCENSYTKYIFHVKDGASSSSYSSQSSYNRDSWVQTLKKCNHTVENNTSSPYGTELYDHTGSSSFKKRNDMKHREPSEVSLYSCTGRVEGVVEGSILPVATGRNQRLNHQASLQSQLDKSGSENSSEPITTTKKSVRSSRRQFLSRIMSEKESASHSSDIHNPEVDSAALDGNKLSANQHIGQDNTDENENRNCHDTVFKMTPSQKEIKSPGQARSSSRKQFLNSILAEKENEISNSFSRCDYYDDDLDFVPRSVRKVLHRSHETEHLVPFFAGDDAMRDHMFTNQTPTVPSRLDNSFSVLSSRQLPSRAVSLPDSIPRTPVQSFQPTNLNFSVLSLKGIH